MTCPLLHLHLRLIICNLNLRDHSAMWLNRYSGQSSPSSASPVPQRRPSHLAPNPLPQRPGLTPRASSLSLLISGSTESLPHEAKQQNGSSLRRQLDSSPTDPVAEPLDVLYAILGPSQWPPPVNGESFDKSVLDNVDFGELSLHEFADAGHSVSVERHDESSSPSFQECRSGHITSRRIPYLDFLRRREGEEQV